MLYCSGMQPFLNAGYSNTRDLVKCQQWFLKHNINISKHQLVFILTVFVLDYDEMCSFSKK